MSFGPPFSVENNAFPPSSFNSNNTFKNVNAEPPINPNNFPSSHYINASHMNRSHLSTHSSFDSTPNANGTNHIYNNAQLHRPPINVPPLPRPSFINTPSPNLTNFVTQPLNMNQSFRHFDNQSHNKNAVPSVTTNSSNTNLNFCSRNFPVHRFPPPILNVAPTSLPPNVNYRSYQNNTCSNNSSSIPVSLSSLSQFPAPSNQNTINNLSINYSVGNANNSVPLPIIYTSPLTVRSAMTNSSEKSLSNLQNNSFIQMPLQFPPSDITKLQNLIIPSNPLIQEKERKITEFLAKFSAKEKEKKPEVTIPEFRYVIKAAIRLIKMLNERKTRLLNLVDASENQWKFESENALQEQEELSTLCSFINSPDHLNSVIEKLKLIKKRRERKKKTKQNKLSEKMRAEQKRKERDQEIDKWLDDIKEKNQKIKREAELKKEADYILLEVRRKIYEAKKTIEKIKVFEKLRNARQANATQKGLHVLSMHNVKFEKKMSVLKETMHKQLADYEAEEKALKVMLETEQEGQLEEETMWKIKKLKTFLQKKQENIMECLFGVSDDPLPTDPLYLFHKYHTSASSSIESLVQIRRQWDIHIAEDGEVIPQHWVVPVAPSNVSWEQCLVASEN